MVIQGCSERVRIIIESVAELTNSDLEDGFTNKGVRPDSHEQVIFRDELARHSSLTNGYQNFTGDL